MTARLTIVSCMLLLATEAAARDVPFRGEFRIPAVRVIWSALNEPTARDLQLEWKDIDPKKDNTRPGDFWRRWPTPFSPFYAGVRMPPEAFTLAALCPDRKLVYPQASYDPNVDFQTFFDLHESLAWLYAFDSPGNPFFAHRPLGLRARQLALAHLVYMTQHAPAGNIIGGHAIQYGNCLAWNAHTLALLDKTQPIDPVLKAAWIDCMDHVARTLDVGGPELLETGMGHWNLWPICGAFRLWQVSGRDEHKTLFEKWARLQLEPDQFTTPRGDVSGMSPVGYIRYSGVDLGYNGQAKNWMAPLFARLGPDSLVGHFARRQYRFASFVTLEEPDGSFTSPSHMSSHSWQSVPYEQWAAHQHIAYAAHLSDAAPFARDTLAQASKAGGKDAFVAGQRELRNHKIKMLPPMPMGVRSYPSNYLHLPPALVTYPAKLPADTSTRTRPHEHLAYAKHFASPLVRDEWFTRRTPAYHATVFAGPCRDEISNYGGRLNGIGSGGLSHVWADGAGTVLLGYSNLSNNASPNGDFEKVWSQLPVNMMVGETRSGNILCTGWTGALMSAPGDGGRQLRVEGGIAPRLRRSYGTPMTDRCNWKRTMRFDDDRISVVVTLHSTESLVRLEELFPVALFGDTKISATSDRGEHFAAPWEGRRLIRSLQVRRGPAGVNVELSEPADTAWAREPTEAVGATGSGAHVRTLRIAVPPDRPKLRYTLKFFNDHRAPTPVFSAADEAVLPTAHRGKPYATCLEAPGGQAVYWEIVNGALPAKLTLDRRGLLSGTPSGKGMSEIDVVGRSPYKNAPFDEADVTVKNLKLVVE